MASSRARTALKWFSRFLQLLIGVFGALAIIGVYFKIQKLPNWEWYMAIGFLGEAGAFIIMGLFPTIEGLFGVDDEEPVRADDGERIRYSEAAQASFRKMMEEKISDDLNVMMRGLAEEVQRFGSEARAMGAEMEQARAAAREMRTRLSEVASSDLAGDTEKLGQSIQHLGREMHAMGSEMQQSRQVVEEARGVLASMAASNLAGDAERFEHGMKLLGDEVHAMSEEMGPARQAVHSMRTELDRVTSGDLAGDAERLGQGMKVLGSEMKGAGATVESIRADLEQMAARFRQFNNPLETNNHLPGNNKAKNLS